MESLEKMREYISRTKAVSLKYDIMGKEIADLVNLSHQNPIEAISLSFQYGRAKGYRSAKREARV